MYKTLNLWYNKEYCCGGRRYPMKFDKKIKNDIGVLWLFNYDSPEFEKVRELCLQDENNWLRDNYTQENLKVTDHVRFAVQYDHDSNPLLMAGVKELTPDVARVFNRWYLFPVARTSTKNWTHDPALIKIFAQLLSPNGTPFWEMMEIDYKLLCISMQQRHEKKVGQQLWWKIVYRTIKRMTDEWKNYDKGLVQVFPGELSTCYQNVIYLTKDNYTFEDWNPKIMSYDEHYLRFNHESDIQN